MTAAATKPKPPTPHELRDGMIEDYTENARRLGGDVSSVDIERIVMSDLSIFEHAKQRAATSKPREFVVDDREDTAKINARNQGMELYRRPVTGDEPKAKRSLLDAPAFRVSQKFPAMMERIRRICQPTGDKPTQRGLGAAIAVLAHPKLAREFVHLFLCYQQPAMPHKSNPFRDVASPRDRALMFLRMTEDICDRSTGVLGPWWVR